MKIEYWVVGVGKWSPQAKMETLPMDFQRPVLDHPSKELEVALLQGIIHGLNFAKDYPFPFFDCLLDSSLVVLGEHDVRDK